MTHPPSDWLPSSFPQPERRRRRSANPSEALGFWLESSRERAKLRNLVLASDLGVLVSGAGTAEEWEELAAWAPLVPESPASKSDALALSSVKLPGYPAYVCSERTEGVALLAEVAAGCARILDSDPS